MSEPRLTFLSELDGRALEALFRDPGVISRLLELRASISLGTPDLSPERAGVVRRLNEAGIPVIAWQLLPREQGYWYNMCNSPQAVDRYAEFIAWTTREGLQWSGIGVDIEPDIGEFQYLLTQKWRLVRAVLRRGCGKRQMYAARSTYATLLRQMESDGYRVESYEFPFMVDELKAGSTLLRRFLGVTDVPAGRHVLMLYSSFFRPFGSAVLWSYAPDADSVGIGITGGGIDLEGIGYHAPLNWEEFARDLRLARRWRNDLHIFSLEGCVRQGFLEQLPTFDWNRPTRPPQPWTVVVALLRRLLRATLWCSAHPLVVAGALLALGGAYLL